MQAGWLWETPTDWKMRAAAHLPGQSLSGRGAPGLWTAAGQASEPARNTLCTNGTHTQELRPSWAAAWSSGQRQTSGAGDRKEAGTGKGRKQSTDGQTGPTELAPGLTLAW